jgi:hypothetical protein
MNGALERVLIVDNEMSLRPHIRIVFERIQAV